jgi:hypothetical protein
MHAPVAQLDRAAAYGAVGWGFDSLRAYTEVPPKIGGSASWNPASKRNPRKREILNSTAKLTN